MIGIDQIEDGSREMFTDNAQTHFFQKNLHVFDGDLPVAVLIEGFVLQIKRY